MSDWDELSPNLTTKNFILVFVGTLGLVFIAVLAFAISGDGLYFAHEISESALFVMQDYVYVALILSGVYILAIKIAKLSWSDIGFRATSFDWIIRGFFLGVLIYSFRTLADGAMIGLFGVQRMLEPAGTDRAILNEASSDTVIAFIAVVSVLTPLATEMFQRGILFVWLRRNFNFLLSAIASAIIFGALHIELVRYFQALLFGVAAAFLYEKSRSLWPSIIFHMTVNIAYIITIMKF